MPSFLNFRRGGDSGKPKGSGIRELKIGEPVMTEDQEQDVERNISKYGPRPIEEHRALIEGKRKAQSAHADDQSLWPTPGIEESKFLEHTDAGLKEIRRQHEEATRRYEESMYPHTEEYRERFMNGSGEGKSDARQPSETHRSFSEEIDVKEDVAAFRREVDDEFGLPGYMERSLFKPLGVGENSENVGERGRDSLQNHGRSGPELSTKKENPSPELSAAKRNKWFSNMSKFSPGISRFNLGRKSRKAERTGPGASQSGDWQE